METEDRYHALGVLHSILTRIQFLIPALPVATIPTLVPHGNPCVPGILIIPFNITPANHIAFVSYREGSPSAVRWSLKGNGGEHLDKGADDGGWSLAPWSSPGDSSLALFTF